MAISPSSIPTNATRASVVGAVLVTPPAILQGTGSGLSDAR